MEDKLIKEAMRASLNSYSPYSNFPVGASLLTKDGRYFIGSNIENASFGLTNCAERSCLFGAYSQGIRKDDIIEFCVYSPKNHLIPPCGACRQVMSELLNHDCKIVMAYGEEGKVKVEVTTIKELLPYIFEKGDMDND